MGGKISPSYDLVKDVLNERCTIFEVIIKLSNNVKDMGQSW